jgi:hypothetical protein
MDVAANCESSDTFYKVDEGGKMVLWRRNDSRSRATSGLTRGGR